MTIRPLYRGISSTNFIHSATTPVINGDNKMITRGYIGWIIWIIQIIKGHTDTADNNSYAELFKICRVGVISENAKSP